MMYYFSTWLNATTVKKTDILNKHFTVFHVSGMAIYVQCSF